MAPALAASLVLAACVRLPAMPLAVDLGQWWWAGRLMGLGLLGVVAYLLAIMAFERGLEGYQPLRSTMALWHSRGR